MTTEGEATGSLTLVARQVKRKRSVLSRAPRPALLESVSAVQAVNSEIRAYKARDKEYPDAVGHQLEGYHLTCDVCHTSLADVHFACEEDKEDCSAICLECPRTDECKSCGSNFVARTISRKPAEGRQLYAYAERAVRFVHTTTYSKARAEADAAESRLEERARAVGVVSRKKNGFYETDIEDADIVVKQALREGIPVVIRQAGKKFESRPFEAQNLAQVVHEQNVQAETREDVREAEVEAHSFDAKRTGGVMTVEQFFRPMIEGDNLEDIEDDPNQEDTSGYGLRDVGINPPQQSQAFFNGCDSLKLGSMVRPNGSNNLCSALPNFEQDPICGTSKPDLGPKLYIARPRLQTVNDQKVFQGHTFTHLHCDLADAANLSFGKGDAEWTIFDAESRGDLADFLARHHKTLFFTKNEALPWLTADQLKTSNLSPAVIVQHPGDLMIIPAGCAHQVENFSDAYTVKAAQDFISAYSLERCLQLKDELRTLFVSDDLQIQLTILFNAASSVEWIEEGTAVGKHSSPSPGRKQKKKSTKPAADTPPAKKIPASPEPQMFPPVQLPGTWSDDSDLEKDFIRSKNDKHAAKEALANSAAIHAEQNQKLAVAQQAVVEAEKAVNEAVQQLEADRAAFETASQEQCELEHAIRRRVEQAHQTLAKLKSLT